MMMDRKSSYSEEEDEEEEEDSRRLIQAEAASSTFQIDDQDQEQQQKLKNSSSSGSGSGSGSGIVGNIIKKGSIIINSKRRYLLAITLPLIILLIIYFTTADFKSLFLPTSTTTSSSSSLLLQDSAAIIRESQLQALYLLQHQQSLLLHLLSSSNLTSSSSHLRSALVDQLSLNNKIQQALLSSHHLGEDSNYNVTQQQLQFLSSLTCTRRDQKKKKKQQQLSERRTIEWKPRQDKYLFPICTSGQMSNHLICLEKHMFFAALLNRVLVIPSPKVDYDFSRVLDIDHINTCLGRQVVLTFEDFANRRQNHVRIDNVLCYFSLPQPCYVDDDHLKKLKSIGVTLSTSDLKTVWADEDVKKPTDRTVHDVTENFSTDDDVLAIGDVFFADVEKEWVMQPGGPIAHKCQTLIEPSRVILLTAQRFIQTFLGQNFVALHFRRHGFLKFCNAKNPSCFFPIPQAAECISRLVERANMPVIYLSTDAADSETSLLQSLVTLNGKTVPLVTRPSRNSAEKWDALLYRKKLDGDPQVEAMLDKTISALSGVFIGAPGSTFTEDILRLRRGWGTASECDEYLCEGEVPNFIAGDE